MPVNIHPTDSAPHADSVAQHVVPVQADTAALKATADTAARPVIEVPEPVQAQPFARSPLHDTPSMALLLTGVLAVTLCYHTGHKYIENFFHYMFSTRRRENLFEDHTVNETSILAALIANTCIVEGFIVYFAVQLLWPGFADSLKSQVFTHIAAFSGMAVGFYLIQWLVYKVMGYTFTDQTGSRLWIDGFKSSQSLLGLVLLPVLVLLMLYPAHGKVVIYSLFFVVPLRRRNRTLSHYDKRNVLDLWYFTIEKTK